MVVFPKAKVNVGLRVLHKRSDGYHNVSTIMVPVPLCDALEVLPAAPGEVDDTFSTSGLAIAGSADQNLVLRALALLRQDRKLGPLRVHLHKRIPMGAGLGGGSSDGTAMLLLLNDLFKLALPVQELEGMAAELGSDCPFFVSGSTAHARGRGELLQALPPALKGYAIAILFSDRPIATAAAYASIQLKAAAELPVTAFAERPPQEWRTLFVNDFEAVAFAKWPEMARDKQRLYAAGAHYASMTGSGSAIYGIFEHISQARSAVKGYPNYWCGEL